MITTVSTTSELVDAVEKAGPGSEIVARGGKYNISGRWNINTGGDQNEQLVIRAADGERPHIKFAAGLNNPTNDSGIKVNEPYVTVRGFEISDSGFKGIFAGSNGHDVVFEDLDVHHCNVWGIMNNGNDNVVFRNCDSHDNMDPQNQGQNADGINMTGPAKNGLIEGCRAWNNGDDGYDLWVSENHTVRYCWAWNNGQGKNGNGNGFKLGSSRSGKGGGHFVHHCVSYGNKVNNDSYSPGSGFWWNGEDDSVIQVYNCTAWDNGVDFAFDDIGHILKNNISYEGGVDIGGPVIQEANSWNMDVSDPGFRSLDPSSDRFLHLSESSPYRDVGVPIESLDNGENPDLGAFPYDGGESGSSAEPVTVDGKVTLTTTDVTIDSNSQVQSNHSGFNGAGYINFAPDEGSFAQWLLEVATAGLYNFKIRYANGKDSDRTVDMILGETVRQVTFPQTDGWTNWSTVTGTVDLPSGSSELRIETTGEDGGNIDQIILQPTSDSGLERQGDTPYHGYHIPDKGQADWHVPLNENLEAIDRDIPIVDTEIAIDQYEPKERVLYIAMDTGAVYIGDGTEWGQLGVLN